MCYIMLGHHVHMGKKEKRPTRKSPFDGASRHRPALIDLIMGSSQKKRKEKKKDFQVRLLLRRTLCNVLTSRP